MEVLLSVFYTLVFLLLIRKLKFFQLEGLSKNVVSIFFSIKVLFGVMLWWVYTYYYTDHATADIYKYFDDSKIMYDALWVHPSDYVKMLLGIQNDNPYFDRVYYTHMNHWYHEFGNNIYNDNHTIIRFNAFVRLFSFGHYNVHSVFICFISFTGLTAIYKTFITYLSDKKKELALAVFLIPSVLFWSSGVLKEGFLFFGLGMLVYYFHQVCFVKCKLIYFLWIAFSLMLLILAKFYVLACLTPGLIAWFWICRAGEKKAGFKFYQTLIVLVIMALCIQFVSPKYNVLKQLAWKQSDFVASAKGGTYLKIDATLSQLLLTNNDTLYIKPRDEMNLFWIKKDSICSLKQATNIYQWSKGSIRDSASVGPSSNYIFRLIKHYDAANSRINITPLQPTIYSLFANTPEAFLNSLLRPYPFESKSPMILFPAIENIFILLFCAICIVFSSFKKADKKIFYFCIIFVFLLYTLTGLTTPVTGAIVRYRIPAMPFLLIAFLSILDKEKLLKRMPFLKFLI